MVFSTEIFIRAAYDKWIFAYFTVEFIATSEYVSIYVNKTVVPSARAWYNHGISTVNDL